MIQSIIHTQKNNMQHNFFSILLDGEILGIPIDCVQTIFKIPTLTRVPGGPKEIDGLVNLRGKIVTVINLKRRLNVPHNEVKKDSYAIGVEHKQETFGLLVDHIGDVINLTEVDIIDAPAHIDKKRALFAQRYYKYNDKILPILDMNTVFDLGSDKKRNQHKGDA
jgi:purine-binding chemotaxis protein CheW